MLPATDRAIRTVANTGIVGTTLARDPIEPCYQINKAATQIIFQSAALEDGMLYSQ